MAAPRAGPAHRLLQGLSRWFYDVEAALNWAERLRRLRLHRINASHVYLRDTYGPDMAAAAFTLSLGGGVRYEGQEEWLRPHGPWQAKVLELRSAPVRGLDLSACPVTYSGLDNVVPLSGLELLDLSACPHVDDWALARLHSLGPSLRALSLSRCPRVTERGLATLHHFRELRYLDVTGLAVSSPGLVRILLEEMLPGCRIVGMELETPPPSPGTT
ncbi:distal membrane-arm assembly complex protein 2-like [Neopsephotus bourkii]|uniref:distal membrane-arm assembly complex protein 2-like n=1 Tax=Neopsephotus bourkii TaxID=309878 RepID=UPI002AA55B72|nr:distal membrane-arm assembly complex protein 2-like [Neopsephotus bourkii]